jgi:hypothetical protein
MVWAPSPQSISTALQGPRGRNSILIHSQSSQFKCFRELGPKAVNASPYESRSRRTNQAS